MAKKKLSIEGKVYLIFFVVAGIVSYLHASGIINPFNQMSNTPNWVWITLGIVLGLVLEKGLNEI